ncbi:hypothetical protein LTR10_020198 [Elasticomyces elasticus]|uniref:F-box domain-containing protein n=1 Tax=Exophiala sideris TaxID=1016849 RepID=A0ABR0JEE2_9EURO|nr:hypothetical protein LTR10_020198 [Elasticomyces elasticus]KAK5031366.1 hypothetical protein LTS07_005101 [Exophiala sideris]KAK5039086.1 hypothetical protein LTR13_004117 [Exophiala sideris]KAK5060971.1 hypothetical protein LTR69_005570 [Exophiala sideris]KAK5183882.1 hypothetical protein LTR44_004164 [Eurotiomycetes sp. CCFEE 6388]
MDFALIPSTSGQRLVMSYDVKEPMKSTKKTGSTPNTWAKQQSHHHDALVDLPDELVLIVASSLDKESQILLSLSCKRFHVLLNTYLDLALPDKATKVRLLLCLEIDHPEYLTCRACGLLYEWRMMQSRHYECPHANEHQSADTQLSYRRLIRAGDNDYTLVSRAVVDLILRAYEHGDPHGLPLTSLNTSGKDRHGIIRTNQARLIDGQLILANRLEVEGGEEMATMARFFDMELCIHFRANPGHDDRFRAVEKAVKGLKGSRKKRTIRKELFKCLFCETDHELYVESSAEKRIKIVLDVWRNYGRLHSNSPSHEQIFHQYPVLRVAAKTVSKRDVRAVFESGR